MNIFKFNKLCFVCVLCHSLVSCKTATPSLQQDEQMLRNKSAIPLTPEDLAGIMSLRLDKFELPPSPNSKGWDIIFYLERAGKPVQQIGSSYIPPNNSLPYMVGFKTPPAGAPDLEFYYAAIWTNTKLVSVPNPAASKSMRFPSSYPPKPGRNVLMLWRTSGQGGWDPGDADFVQRIVMELRFRQ